MKPDIAAILPVTEKGADPVPPPLSVERAASTGWGARYDRCRL
jgi:hypothetical protein